MLGPRYMQPDQLDKMICPAQISEGMGVLHLELDKDLFINHTLLDIF